MYERAYTGDVTHLAHHLPQHHATHLTLRSLAARQPCTATVRRQQLVSSVLWPQSVATSLISIH
ncbi:hypothetical protein E2C01_004581 [Portunus trituberculatus]|uniref:Uncharacterized protein n=1 Tax=Portunus trituberculatus TaxID=210409 RepID=A0A5B7CUC8_PORTR|nr:hypothetical protein [Portunus trituberculatus]